MGKKRVDSVVRAQIVALSDVGHSQVEFSKQLKASRHFVPNAIKKYKETGQYTDLQRTGHSKRVPDRGVRYPERLVKGDG